MLFSREKYITHGQIHDAKNMKKEMDALERSCFRLEIKTTLKLQKGKHANKGAGDNKTFNFKSIFAPRIDINILPK